MNSQSYTVLDRLAQTPESARPLNTQFFHGKVFHSDLPDHCRAPNFVLPIGPSALLLAYMTIRRPVASALDLGAGCGVLGILAAEHADSVTATDVNPRALALTRLNARLNGVTNIETLRGSTFAPVRGRCFDLILANLPYVISPERQFLYRDMVSPRRMDSLNLLKEIPQYLSQGGFAHLNISWTYRAGQNPWQPLTTSLRKTGLDALLFLAADLRPEEYATLWVPPERVSQWAGWYKSQGMERFALGHLALRARKSPENFFVIFRLDSEIKQDVGEAMERLFAAQDQLDALERSGGWLACVMSPREIQFGRGDGDSVVVSDSSGLGLKLRIRTVTAGCVGWLDGKLSIAEALSSLAPEDIPAVLSELKSLLQFGLLEIK